MRAPEGVKYTKIYKSIQLIYKTHIHRIQKIQKYTIKIYNTGALFCMGGLLFPQAIWGRRPALRVAFSVRLPFYRKVPSDTIPHDTFSDKELFGSYFIVPKYNSLFANNSLFQKKKKQ